MNNEVESYVGELRFLREENETLKKQVKQLEEEKADKEKIKINKTKNSFFSGSLNY